jgi:Bacterial Ig-like domain (group 3)
MRSNKFHPCVVFASLLMCSAFFPSLAEAKTNTTTTLTSSSNPSVYQQSVTLTATVTAAAGTPTGTVTFKQGSNSITKNLVNGVANTPPPNFVVGSYNFTATYNGDANFNTSVSNVLTQVINQATPAITWPNPAPIVYETPLSSTQLNASANVGGSFSYNPPAGTVLNAGNQTLNTTFTPTDTLDYKTVPDSVPLTVLQATPVINWPTPSPITAQAALSATQLDATASFNGSSVAGTFAYNPAAGTMLAAGNDTLNVTFTPSSSNFTTAPGSVQITVYATNTFFVAINGKDTWSGYLSAPAADLSDGPLASPAEAQIKVRGVSNRTAPINVYIRAGTYYLPLSPTNPGTLVFNQIGDSGTNPAPITWQGFPGDAAPVVSGGEPANPDPNTWSGASLNLVWNTRGGGGSLGTQYYALLPANFNNFETLYYNGQRRLRARIHDSGTQTTYPSVGYYMNPSVPGQCLATASTPANQPAPNLASCNLGTYLRVVGTVPYSTSGTTCTLANSVADGNGNTKCLDRFVFAPTTAGGDTITTFANLSNHYSGPASAPCSPTTGNNYPPGDVELTLIDAWTVDVMRINCIESDGNGNIIYLTGPTNGNANNYNLMGPTIGHRYLIENALDAFNTAAQTTGQTGIWFLDRSAGLTAQWTLNYIANAGEHPTTDTIVIPQLGGVIPGAPSTDDNVGSLISAPVTSSGTGLSYVTFTGIDFAVDNFYPSATGFNNDLNGEYSLPQAIYCESCQSVIFNGITVGHTSASGVLIASPGSTGPAATNDVIEYSVFYDIGDSGIRIGHTPSKSSPQDVRANVVTRASVHDNLIKGYSRIFPDGEGIAHGNGNGTLLVNNTITDGYHAGISICFNGCGPPDSSHNNINGNSITSQYNLISNLMQGITSDGGSLYYNIGSQTSSATGGVINSNVVYDTTDSFILDNSTTAKGQVSGSAYGGEGIYLDAQTANVQVTNNVVFNLDGNAIHLTQGVSWMAPNFPTNEQPNAFSNNIFAFADTSMLMQQSPWVQGCPTSLNVTEVTLSDNIFNFTKPSVNNPNFQVVTGCLNACGETYPTYQRFTQNYYYNTNTSAPFSSDTNAFQVLEAQGASGLNSANKNACLTAPYFPLTLGTGNCSWQLGTSGITCTDNAHHQRTLAVTMQEDTTGAVYNSQFLGTGLATDTPGMYSFSGNGLTGPTGYNTAGTDNAITKAGRCTTTQPPTGCLADPAPSGVSPTFPVYTYTSF